MKKNQHISAQPLPFPEWVEQTYPEKTAKREFLRMIGALDLAYLMYRTKTIQKMQKTQRIQKIDTTVTVPSMPLKVEEHKKQPTKPKKSTIVKEEKKDEVTIEFEHKTQPHPSVGADTKAKKKPTTKKAPKKVKELKISFHKETEPTVIRTPKAAPAPVVQEEPEPLVLHEEPLVESKPVAKKKGNTWLDDPSLEEVDLRKLKQPLSIGGITVSFRVRNNQGDDETVIEVNNVAWRASLTSPSLDLSAMAQIVRVSYGELYVLGRMALGAMSGEGYVNAQEAERIVKLLADATGSTVTCDISYFDKDAISKTRVSNIMHVRFERV